MTEPAASLWGGGRGRVLLFCWLGWVFDFYDLILFAFTKGDVARDLGLDMAAVQWAEGWSLLATAIGGLAAGRIADRIGRRQGMVFSIAVFSLGALLTGCATGFWSLLTARAIVGLGVGGEWGIGHAVVADYWSGRQRDKVHGMLQAGSPVAMALAAAVGCFLAPLPGVGWRAVFVGKLWGLVAVFGFIAVLITRPEQRIVFLQLAAPAWFMLALYAAVSVSIPRYAVCFVPLFAQCWAALFLRPVARA